MTKKKEVKVKAPKKMNQRVKKAWLAALRSRKYKQAQGMLREVDYDKEGKVVGYCCLGVLCDVFAKTPTGRKEKAKWKDGSFLGEETYLPDKVREWAGLPGEDEERAYEAAKGYGKETVQEALITLNDSLGARFGRIANWIEKNL